MMLSRFVSSDGITLCNSDYFFKYNYATSVNTECGFCSSLFMTLSLEWKKKAIKMLKTT